ncbi:MAG: OFA family MFS transporter [Ignavibacteria bacterium]|nr:OFA family MFS transporter [Ignavibacteria bacterium]
MHEKTHKNKGWLVTFAGVMISLSLGILYTWSIFKSEIEKSVKSNLPDSFDWNLSSLNDPYSVSILAFAFTMILAGRIQDKIGPRITSLIGGLLVSLGILIISFSKLYIIWVLGFGLLLGMGVAFCYASITPAAIKWFPPQKTGLIAGIVVAGFGLASVYTAPLSRFLIDNFGLHNAMLCFSGLFFVVVTAFSLLLINPSKEYKENNKIALQNAGKDNNFSPVQMFKNIDFYILWFVYFIGAGAGLMVIGFVNDLVKKGLAEKAFWGVVILAIGNAGGRVIAGFLSDKIGRKNTLIIMLSFQMILMFVSVFVLSGGHTSAVILLSIATIIGFNFGTNLSLFPSFTKDLWGLKNFGLNYGIMFTAWGLGGFTLSRVSQMMFTASGSYNSSFIMAGILLLLGIILTLFIKERKKL